MSDSEKVEADSTSCAQQVKADDTKKEEAAPAPTNGSSSNGLSLQLEEKIIRQVEVKAW